MTSQPLGRRTSMSPCRLTRTIVLPFDAGCGQVAVMQLVVGDDSLERGAGHFDERHVAVSLIAHRDEDGFTPLF